MKRKRGKKILIALLGITLFIAIAYLSVMPVTRMMVRLVISKALGGSMVTVGDCRWQLVRRLTLENLHVDGLNRYTADVRQISAEFTLKSLWQKKILNIFVEEPVISVRMPKTDILNFEEKTGEINRPIDIEHVSVRNARININSNDLKLDAGGSASLDLKQSMLVAADLFVRTMELKGIGLENGSIKLAPGQTEGAISVGKIRAGKLAMTELQSTAHFSATKTEIQIQSGELFNGMVSGDVLINIAQTPEMKVSIKFARIDIQQLVRQLELEDKIEMSGFADGFITLQSRGAGVQILNGDFNMSEEGGTLVIKDSRYLESIAQRANQPVDIFVESFQNYHYNTGKVTLGLNDRNLILDLNLDGGTGKRDLTVTLHDLIQ